MALRDKFDGTVMLEDGLEHNPGISRQALAALHDGAFGWALSLTDYDTQAAEDVMQQAYVAVLEGSASFDGNASLRTWLYAVIRNTARRYQRTQKLQRTLVMRLQLAAPGPRHNNEMEVAPAVSESPQAVRMAMRNLPARQKQVLELVIDAEFSLEQAATVLGISVGSARTHYHRAKQSLHRALKEHYGSEG